MDINDQLIEEITRLVLQELKVGDTSPRQNSVSNVVKSHDPKEVIVGLGPAFLTEIKHTICGLDLRQVLKEICAGIEEEGMHPRVLRVMKTSDVCFIGKEVAMLSGSGIGIGIQSKGTTVIHQKDLYPLTNLELFPQAPLITLDTYRKIGKNAARYAKQMHVEPIPMENDPNIRAKYQVKAALMHTKETQCVIKDGGEEEVFMNEVSSLSIS